MKEHLKRNKGSGRSREKSSGSRPCIGIQATFFVAVEIWYVRHNEIRERRINMAEGPLSLGIYMY